MDESDALGSTPNWVRQTTIEEALRIANDDQLRAEARRRGMELQSQQFSQAAQQAIRDQEWLRNRLAELEAKLTLTDRVKEAEALTRQPEVQIPPKLPKRRFAKSDEDV